MEYRLAPRWGGAVRLAEFCKNGVKHPPLHAPILARRLGGRCLVSRYYARASADHDCTLLRSFIWSPFTATKFCVIPTLRINP